MKNLREAKFHTIVYGEEVPEVGSQFEKTDCLIVVQKEETGTNVDLLYADGNGKVVKSTSNQEHKTVSPEETINLDKLTQEGIFYFPNRGGDKIEPSNTIHDWSLNSGFFIEIKKFIIDETYEYTRYAVHQTLTLVDNQQFITKRIIFETVAKKGNFIDINSEWSWTLWENRNINNFISLKYLLESFTSEQKEEIRKILGV